MNMLCTYFPGADTPIEYDNSYSEEVMSEESDQEDDTLDYQDSFPTSTRLPADTTSTEQSNESLALSNPAVMRRTNVCPQIRPHSFVESQISRLQSGMLSSTPPRPLSIAIMPHTKTPVASFGTNRIGQVQIPEHFKKNPSQQKSSPTENTPTSHRKVSTKSPNRSLNSPHKKSESDTTQGQVVPCYAPTNRSQLNQYPSGGSTPQNSTQHETRFMNKSPVYFSESSSPRRSPMLNYNVGNMNPRHTDIEAYWNQEHENSTRSPMRNTLSPNPNTYFYPQSQDNWNSSPGERSNEGYWNHVASSNEGGVYNLPLLNGNVRDVFPGGLLAVPDPRLQAPLQINVNPVSIQYSSYLLHGSWLTVALQRIFILCFYTQLHTYYTHALQLVFFISFHFQCFLFITNISILNYITDFFQFSMISD